MKLGTRELSKDKLSKDAAVKPADAKEQSGGLPEQISGKAPKGIGDAKKVFEKFQQEQLRRRTGARHKSPDPATTFGALPGQVR